MWEPRRLTALWAFMACYRVSFTLHTAVWLTVLLHHVTDKRFMFLRKRVTVYIFFGVTYNWLKRDVPLSVFDSKVYRSFSHFALWLQVQYWCYEIFSLSVKAVLKLMVIMTPCKRHNKFALSDFKLTLWLAQTQNRHSASYRVTPLYFTGRRKN
jgi:hypothetical protein